MAKGPGLYTEIGKKARDLLYKDYQSDHKFTVTTYSPTGVGKKEERERKKGNKSCEIIVRKKERIGGIPAALRDISYCYTFELPRYFRSGSLLLVDFSL
ncbi:unnamed protein product [Camellia sinensis]